MTKGKQEVNGFDLAAPEFTELQAAQEAGISVSITHPGTGEPMDVTIVVAGPDSSHAKKADRRMMNTRLQQRKMKKLTAEELQTEGLKKLASLVLSWSGLTNKGKPFECNSENILEVFAKAPWIAEQVAEAAGDRAAFFPN